jgi:hypothetical protein
MSRPHACYLMSCAMDRMLWKFRGSSCLRVVYMTTADYEGGKLLNFVSNLNFLKYVAAKCYFTFRGFRCVCIQWSLFRLSNVSILRTSGASGGCVYESDTATEYPIKLRSMWPCFMDVKDHVLRRVIAQSEVKRRPCKHLSMFWHSV